MGNIQYFFAHKFSVSQKFHNVQNIQKTKINEYISVRYNKNRVVSALNNKYYIVLVSITFHTLKTKSTCGHQNITTQDVNSIVSQAVEAVINNNKKQ